MGYSTENNGNETQTKNVIFAPVALPIPFCFAGWTCPWRGWWMEVGHHPASCLVQGHNFSIRLLLCNVLLRTLTFLTTLTDSSHNFPIKGSQFPSLS